METQEPVQMSEPKKKVTGRNFVLTLLSLVANIFFGLLSLIFLAGVIYSGWISTVINQYIPENQLTKSVFRILMFAFFLLHACAFTGSIYTWKSRKSGYFLVAIPSLILASTQLFMPGFSVVSFFTYIFFVVGFGFFYRKFH